jgi:hypothetical protein
LDTREVNPSLSTKVPRKDTLPVAMNSVPSRHGRSVMTCGGNCSSPEKCPTSGGAALAAEPATRQTTKATITDTALSVARMTTSNSAVRRPDRPQRSSSGHRSRKSERASICLGCAQPIRANARIP